MIHENSRRTYNELRNTLNDREMSIYDAYLQNGAMPDRMVKDLLEKDDMNDVRPRISELVKKGLLTELPYKVLDYKTKIHVRVCRPASVKEFLATTNKRQLQLMFV
jgi:hypothetical protein